MYSGSLRAWKHYQCEEQRLSRSLPCWKGIPVEAATSKRWKGKDNILINAKIGCNAQFPSLQCPSDVHARVELSSVYVVSMENGLLVSRMSETVH